MGGKAVCGVRVWSQTRSLRTVRFWETLSHNRTLQRGGSAEQLQATRCLPAISMALAPWYALRLRNGCERTACLTRNTEFNNTEMYTLADPAHVALIIMAALIALTVVNGLLLRFAVLPLLVAYGQARQHETVVTVRLLQRRLAWAEQENRRLRGGTHTERSRVYGHSA